MIDGDETEWGILRWALKRVLVVAALIAVALLLNGIFAVASIIVAFDLPMERTVVQEFEDPRGRFRAVVVHSSNALDDGTTICIRSANSGPARERQLAYYDGRIHIEFSVADDGELRIRPRDGGGGATKTDTLELGEESLRVTFPSEFNLVP